MAYVLGVLSLVALFLPFEGFAEGEAIRPYEVTEDREVCKDYEPLRRPFFGDTHVHTAYSFDANSQDTRNTPEDAYRFARGEEVGIQPYGSDGKALRTARLRRPLDFTAVTDHAEMLGEIRICTDEQIEGYGSDFCWIYRLAPPMMFGPLATRLIIQRDRFNFCGENDLRCLEQAALVWRDIQVAAEQAYDRTAECSFTSFVGYEWTGSIGAGINLHRNVIFRNEHVPVYAPSWVEVPSAYDLWMDLQRRCVEGVPGCDVLTIPHNSNLSGPGIMFESAKLRTVGDASMPVTAEEAALRRRWEPLVEIMQHKGDSECLLGGDTTDEACGFEKLPYNSFAGVGRIAAGNIVDLQGTSLAPDRRAMVREALKKGLVLEEQLGENPLKYGIVASTDTHLGTPGLTMEDEAKGHGGAGDRNRAGIPDNIEFNPGGLAVLWAEENTRDALFSAMQRREAYGTSGTRPVVRFFGGWDYPESLCASKDFASAGYSGGVPMGGDLPPRPDGATAPLFAVSALKDPGSSGHPGTPLERIQIVKGWVKKGEAHEKVFEVAGGDNGSSVDTATCKTQGEDSASLCAVWQDPEFDADEGAFYYVRVLENPTCRWSQQLCVEAGVRCEDESTVTLGYEACCMESVPKTVQERAWTSPIWYSPEP
ncbi:MAG: DUF3604 domain-containing protein [Myxococcota bacterium]|nr:hypothetical protein [Spirochaeta sp.]RPG10139.1 MAG: DUF3604 domain-containing protein [Proteobacteria bacterium TMED72]